MAASEHRDCWCAHFWRESYICMPESIQLKLPFALSSLPSNSKWGPQQSCCFRRLHHLAPFYHHWQPACKLQGQVCIKQIISECQQIMWGSDANLFSAFFSPSQYIKGAFVLRSLTACHRAKHFCVWCVWKRQKSLEKVIKLELV